MKRTRTFGKSSKSDNKELNLEAVSITIKDNETGKIVYEGDAGSLIFATVVEQDEEGLAFSAGMVGEFNLNSLMQSVEAVADTAAQALRDVYDADAEDYLHLMGNAVSTATTRNFSKEDQAKAIIKGIAKMADEARKNNSKDNNKYN